MVSCSLTLKQWFFWSCLTSSIESLEWFAQELKQLQSHQQVNVLVHITRPTDITGLSSPTTTGSLSEKGSLNEDVAPVEPSLTVTANDLEKSALQNFAAKPPSVNETRPGRPDIGNLIKVAATSCGNSDDRVIVGACGPSDLMHTIRNAVNNDIRDDGPSITLYTEVSKGAPNDKT